MKVKIKLSKFFFWSFRISSLIFWACKARSEESFAFLRTRMFIWSFIHFFFPFLSFLAGSSFFFSSIKWYLFLDNLVYYNTSEIILTDFVLQLNIKDWFEALGSFLSVFYLPHGWLRPAWPYYLRRTFPYITDI